MTITKPNDTNADAPEHVDISALPELLNTRQAAAVLSVTTRTVTRMCELGKLKAVRVMSVWRINRDALLEFAGLI